VRFLLNLFFVIVTTASALQACPTCKDSFMKKDSTGGPQMVSDKLNSVGLGFGWSVIFMLAAPASVAGGLVWLVVKNGNEASRSHVS
jgi:hypothetical protein